MRDDLIRPYILGQLSVSNKSASLLLRDCLRNILVDGISKHDIRIAMLDLIGEGRVRITFEGLELVEESISYEYIEEFVSK